MKIAVASSSTLAFPLMERLKAKHDVEYLISTPDKPQKRSASPIPNEFVLGLSDKEIFKPRTKVELTEVVRINPVDLVITLSYGQLVPEDALNIPKYGWLNIHFSLLPKWRGPSPVQSALLNSETDGGISIFQLDKGMDTGPIYDQQLLVFGADETAYEILNRASILSAARALDVIGLISQGERPTPQPQHGESYSKKFVKEDGRLNFTKGLQSAYNHYRALEHNPGVFFENDGKRIVVKKARPWYEINVPEGKLYCVDDMLVMGCGKGSLELINVTPAGSKMMSGIEYARGARIPKF